jgi:hypothetical protein
MSFPFTIFVSCEIVALRENVVYRPESYDSFSAKSCVFLAPGLGYISQYHKQSEPKQDIEKPLCHLPTTLVPSLPYKV